MAIFTPILDIVAGVSILVGNTTVLDTPILRFKDKSLTLRQILGFSFAGIGLSLGNPRSQKKR